MNSHADLLRRRLLLKALASVSGLAASGKSLAAEPASETNVLRIAQIDAGTCWAPQYVAGDLLRSEGFSRLQYVKVGGAGAPYSQIAAGEVDLTMSFIAPFILSADSRGPVVMLAGVHPGCIELFASTRIRNVRELKGKTITVGAKGSASHGFAAAILAHVGLDPGRDVTWLEQGAAEGMRAFEAGKVDAVIATPPRSYAMRAKQIGHVVLNMTTDRPWSQYFCCVLTGNREFVRRNPVATKRAMRAILKAADLCVSSPGSSAKAMTGGVFGYSEAASLQTIKEVSYGRWRELDTEDTVRFYALRLHEAGLIKSNAKKILAEATDFRFLRELKKELKA